MAVRYLTRGVSTRTELSEALDSLGIGPGGVFSIQPMDDSPVEDNIGAYRGSGEHDQEDPDDTSRGAAHDVEPRSGSQRYKIVELMVGLPLERWITRDEIARRLAMWEGSVGPRVKELLDGGWLAEMPGTVETRHKSQARLLEATEKARKWWAALEG